ncbi:MAG: hypothetical protein KF836_08960 [Fimbriimonadaceae bacterium]|nr:hypothetical protein [Fimbriimonadaceae bacterium]
MNAIHNIGLGVFATVLMTSQAQATIISEDNAGNTQYNTGWSSGRNGGSGFEPWTVNDFSQVLAFTGSSSVNGGGSLPTIDTNGRSWALSAFGNVSTSATRVINVLPFSNVTRMSFDFDAGLVDSGTFNGLDNQVSFGINMLSGSAIGVARRNGQSNFEFYLGGGSRQFFTSSLALNEGAMHVDVIRLTPQNYRVQLLNMATGGTDFRDFDLGSTQVLHHFSFLNNNAGSGANHFSYINNLEVDAVPEPVTLTVLGGGLLILIRKRSSK